MRLLSLFFGLCALLLGATADAQSLIPPLESFPLAAAFIKDPKYASAALNAQKAFLIQSGLSNNYNFLRSNAEKKSQKELDGVKDDTSYYIDNYTPVPSKVVFFMVGGATLYAIKKEYVQTFRNPMFDSINHSIVVSDKKALTSVNWNF